MTPYADEAAALDEEIAAAVRAGAVGDFNALALRIFEHQLRYNEPYARYCRALGVTLQAMADSWEAIPAMPAAAYKEASLCTFDPVRAQLAFETSGTTTGRGGIHYMETARLYDDVLLEGFARALLPDGATLRYFMLVPNPDEHPRSSLGYMMRRVAERFGDGSHGWYVRGDRLDTERLVRDLRRARSDGVPACIAATAFALAHALDALDDLGVRGIALPAGSRLMETGGFKGRARAIERSELYREVSRIFSLPPECIVAEYGMTELTSQYYDDVHQLRGGERVKLPPPWMRARVCLPDGTGAAPGTAGALAHVDLANRSSCIAVQTEDVGVACGAGIVLLGRDRNAETRGCSLDAEALRPLATRT